MIYNSYYALQIKGEDVSLWVLPLYLEHNKDLGDWSELGVLAVLSGLPSVSSYACVWWSLWRRYQADRGVS